MEKNNITLIGMPASGKSTRGKLLAKKLGFKFVDGDECIERREKMTCQQIVDNKGDKGFLKIEEKRILELLPLKNCIIAPGGSIIYLEKLMSALKNSSILIFLDEPLEVLEKRLSDRLTRAIVGLKSKSLEELYDERMLLYKKYADITINCFKKSDGEVVNKIIEELAIFSKNDK